MKIFLVFFIFFVLSKKSFGDTRSSFVRDYFTNRNIRQIVVFGCWDPYDQLAFIRDVMQLDTRISYAKIVDDMDMKRLLRVNYYHIGVVLDYDCPRSEIVFEQFSQHRLPFNESYHWLVLSNSMTIPTDAFRHLPLTVETEMTFADRRENFSYVLHDIYNPSYRHNGSLNVTYKGSWTPRDGLNDQLTQYKYIRRGNFHGLTLNFSTFLNHPPVPDLETYLTIPKNRHLDTMIRYHYALVLQLRDTYNFTINLKRSKHWGYLINGTWNGILADMIDGVVDISAAPFQYKTERMDVCEFTVGTFVVRVNFIFRHPKKSTVRNPFLKPFVLEAWYTIAALGIVFLLILFLVAKVERTYHDNSPRTNSQLASDIGLTTVAAISAQGTIDVPRIISGRIAFISLLLWGILLFQFYSASIVGSLLAEPPRFITTINQLRESNIDPWVEDIPYIHDIFRVSSILREDGVMCINLDVNDCLLCTVDNSLTNPGRPWRRSQSPGQRRCCFWSTGKRRCRLSVLVINLDFYNSPVDVPAHRYDFAITTSTEPDILAMYNERIKPTKQRPKGSFTNIYRGLNLVKKGGYAFHTDSATAYKIITDTFSDDEICDLQEIQMIKPTRIMIVTAKKSPFKKMIIYGLRRIIQHGLTDALHKIWVEERPKCVDGHSSTPVPVQLEEFIPAIFLLLMGLIISVCVMILEHCYIYFSQNKISRHSTPGEVSENMEDARAITDDESEDLTDVP